MDRAPLARSLILRVATCGTRVCSRALPCGLAELHVPVVVAKWEEVDNPVVLCSRLEALPAAAAAALHPTTTSTIRHPTHGLGHNVEPGELLRDVGLPLPEDSGGFWVQDCVEDETPETHSGQEGDHRIEADGA